MGLDNLLKPFLFLTFTLQLTSADTHSMQYFYTGVTSGINFPEFSFVGQVDGEQFVYYDSNVRRRIPKTEWVKKAITDDPNYWSKNPQKHLGTEEIFKANVATAMQRFNQTNGLHTVQRMYGCELHDDGTKKAYWSTGYDGEDFISFDLKTATYVAPTPQAMITKNRWDNDPGSTVGRKNYLENICIEWLQKYVGYGRSTLERKVPPKVDLFQKDSSSPVVCHATGFFPKAVMISWQKNGEELYEDVEIRETLPNQDGNFQKRSILKVSPEKLDSDKYACVVQHGSLEKDIVLPVSERRVLSVVPVGLIIGAVVAVLLLVVIGCVGYFVSKKKSGFKPVSQNYNTSK